MSQIRQVVPREGNHDDLRTDRYGGFSGERRKVQVDLWKSMHTPTGPIGTVQIYQGRTSVPADESGVLHPEKVVDASTNH
jgi:hypothetical protein